MRLSFVEPGNVYFFRCNKISMTRFFFIYLMIGIFVFVIYCHYNTVIITLGFFNKFIG